MTQKNQSLTKKFAFYVSQNILGMTGVSLYILADTFFISLTAGSNGITVLNLALPIYGILYALGGMVGVGSATWYTIAKARGDRRSDYVFMNSTVWILLISIPFTLAGIFLPQQLLHLMGGDTEIAKLGMGYVRTFMIFSPLFLLNPVTNAFTRNDGAPSIAMAATLFGSIFNIIFDYIFMFPLGMGLPGAALATGISPGIGIAICLIHLLGKKNQVPFKTRRPSFSMLGMCCKLGFSALIIELSAAITTTVFNFLLLGIAGNVGVAAYGVVANLALVATAIFNGIAQGSQPLVSESYGRSEQTQLRKLLGLCIGTAVSLSLLLYVLVFVWTDPIVRVFNSEGNTILAAYAHSAVRIYFFGYLMAGFNIVLSGYFSAVNAIHEAFICSALRGVVAIIGCSVVLAMLFGINGVWAAFPAAESITMIVGLILLLKNNTKKSCK